MATSVVIHALICFAVSFPAPVTDRFATKTSTLPDDPTGIRISGIVVAEQMTQLESAVGATEETEEVVAEVAEFVPEEPPPVPTTRPADPSPILELERPRTADMAPAAALQGRFANSLLWRNVRGALPDLAFTSIVPMSVRAGRGGESRTTPTDPWAFATWTTQDAEGRLWGAGPGLIYLGGIVIPTCGERFDASNCGFGLPVERRGEYQFFLRAWLEIERQEQRETIMERARAMRERQEALWDTVPLGGIYHERHAECRDGVFAPLQEVEEATPAQVCQVFFASNLKRFCGRHSVVAGFGSQLRVLGERGGCGLR